MLLKAVANCNRKKSLEEYRSYLLRVSYLIFVFSVLSIGVSHFVKSSDFASGLLLGMGISGFAFTIYYQVLCHQTNRLKAAYVAVYDERNQFILRLSAASTLILMFITNVFLLILYAFCGVVFSYLILLLIWLYSLIFGFLILKVIFSKIL